MIRRSAALVLAVVIDVGAVSAEELCLAAPYQSGNAEIAALMALLTEALAGYPSLDTAFRQEAPSLCISDALFQEQGYFEPKTNRIVLRKGLDPDLQLAILIHEIRHLEQYSRDICPTTQMTLPDYVRLRLALEADAAAIGVHIAWDLRETGRPGPWEQLRTWPSHQDLTARYSSEIAAGGDEIAATAATYAQWFEDPDRRAIYAYAICSNYLDALERDNFDAGHATLPDDLTDQVCVMPDGQPYPCVLPP